MLFFLFCTVQGFSFDKDTGVIAGNKVRMRSEPSLSGKILKELFIGEVVFILNQSEKTERIDKNRQFSYYWYEVKTAEGKRGWIFGQFVYRYQDKKNAKMLIENSTYRIEIFKEEEFCPDMPDNPAYSMPFLCKNDESFCIPLFMNETMLKEIPHSYGREGSSYYKMIRDTGISEECEWIAVDKKKNLILQIQYGTQTGGGEYKLKTIYNLQQKSWNIIECFDIQRQETF
ncbi:MAG: hypothetical protein A2Y41_01665 [Spirochaetes bacterium GWB1_36_13]|nr:MAG: hypothetical protein A2Y41_01665 [Spirochaetes bacterium GWB1_36_13]